jgi:hypothetical protein
MLLEFRSGSGERRANKDGCISGASFPGRKATRGGQVGGVEILQTFAGIKANIQGLDPQGNFEKSPLRRIIMT